MQLSEIMTKQLESVSSKTTLKDAAARMAECDIGMLPVVDEGKITGTITDRDICINAVAAGLTPTDTPVSKAMTPHVVTCGSDVDIEDAARKMSEHKVRRIVVTESGKPVGVVSLGDLAKGMKNAETVGKTLASVS